MSETKKCSFLRDQRNYSDATRRIDKLNDPFRLLQTGCRISRALRRSWTMIVVPTHVYAHVRLYSSNGTAELHGECILCLRVQHAYSASRARSAGIKGSRGMRLANYDTKVSTIKEMGETIQEMGVRWRWACFVYTCRWRVAWSLALKATCFSRRWSSMIERITTPRANE